MHHRRLGALAPPHPRRRHLDNRAIVTRVALAPPNAALRIDHEQVRDAEDLEEVHDEH